MIGDVDLCIGVLRLGAAGDGGPIVPIRLQKLADELDAALQPGLRVGRARLKLCCPGGLGGQPVALDPHDIDLAYEDFRLAGEKDGHLVAVPYALDLDGSIQAGGVEPAQTLGGDCLLPAELPGCRANWPGSGSSTAASTP